MYRQVRFGTLLFLLSLIMAIGVANVVYWWVTGNWNHKGIISVIQQALAALTIVLVWFVVFAKWELDRHFEPHLTISHEISHRNIGSEYIHIAVKTRLHNSSKVRVDILEGLFKARLISPLPDEKIKAIYSKAFETSDQDDRRQPLGQLTLVWKKDDFIIEPGGSHQRMIEFIVGVDCESVLIYTYVYNPKYQNGKFPPMGWGESTVYDVARAS